MALQAGTAFITVKPLVDRAGFSGLKRTLAIATVGAVAAVGAGALAIGKSFDDMSDTIRVGTGASGDALAELERSAKNVGKVTPASFQDIGTAIADVNKRLGLTGRPLELMSRRFLNLSRITGTDLSQNIADVTRLFGDWSVATKDQPKALDKLLATSQATGIGINALAQQAVKFGAPMRQFGFSFEETISLMGKWEKEGVNAQLVMGGLKIGLGKFSKAGQEPKKALEDVTTAIKNAGSAGEANQIAIEAFGQRAGPDMAAAVREGRFEIGDMLKALKSSKGALNSADKDTRDFAESWQIFKNRAMVGLAPLAARAFDGLTKIGVWINATGVPALTSMSDWIKDNVIPALSSMAGFVQDNEKPIAAVAAVITVVFLPALIQMAVQATVSAALTAAAWVLIQASAIKATAVSVVQFAVQGAKWVWLGVTAMASAVRIAAAWLISMGPIGLVVAAVVGLVIVVVKNWDRIKSAITSAATAVLDFLKAHWPMILAILTGPIGIATLLVVKNFDKIKAAASFMWDSVLKPIFKAWINLWFSVVGAILNGAAKAFGWVPGLGGKLKAAAEKFNDFRDSVNRSLDGIHSVKEIRLKVSTQQIVANPSLAKPRERARGGPVTAGRMYLVGEEGPELWLAPNTGRILPHRETMSMLSRPAFRDPQPGELARRAAADSGVGSGVELEQALYRGTRRALADTRTVVVAKDDLADLDLLVGAV